MNGDEINPALRSHRKCTPAGVLLLMNASGKNYLKIHRNMLSLEPESLPGLYQKL